MDENLVLKNIGWSVFGISASYFLLKQIRDKNRKETINEVIYTRSSEINFSSQIFKNIIYERHHPLLRNLEILENIIDSATKSIHLAMFMMTSNDLANVLIKAKDRGVKVFVFLDKDLGGGNAENIAKRLIKKKIEVKVNDQFKMNHLKLCLIDVKSIAGIFQLIDDTIKTTFKKRVKRPLNLPSSGITVSGSMNWTLEGLTCNEENIFINSDENICRNSLKRFEEMWNDPNSRLLDEFFL